MLDALFWFPFQFYNNTHVYLWQSDCQRFFSLRVPEVIIKCSRSCWLGNSACGGLVVAGRRWKGEKRENEICKALRSEDFSEFYKYFDMKTKFNRSYLNKFNLEETDYCKTRWFKQQIAEVLGINVWALITNYFQNLIMTKSYFMQRKIC